MDSDMGFVGDALEHGISVADQIRLLRRVVQYRRTWRRPNGEMYPVRLTEGAE